MAIMRRTRKHLAARQVFLVSRFTYQGCLLEVRGFSDSMMALPASRGYPNRRNFCTTPNGFPMTLFWFLMVALVLGGVLASLWYQENRRGIWFGNVRVPAPVPALWRAGRGHGPHARSVSRSFALGLAAPPGRHAWACRLVEGRLADLRAARLHRFMRPRLL